MTRQEVIEFLCETCNSMKKDMKTINAMIEEGYLHGYDIIKRGVDNYEIYEAIAIKDFTKPLKIIRDFPNTGNTQEYCGVPLALLCHTWWSTGFSPELWCYLANKQDGEYIYFSELYDEYTGIDRDTQIAIDLDIMKLNGFLKEKEDCLEFSLQDVYADKLPPCPRHYNFSDKIRLAPLDKYFV